MGRARTATGKRNRSVTFLSSFSTHRHQVVAPVRAANGSAFTACAACKKSVPFALLDFHNRECEELAGSLEAHCQASGLFHNMSLCSSLGCMSLDEIWRISFVSWVIWLVVCNWFLLMIVQNESIRQYLNTPSFMSRLYCMHRNIPTFFRTYMLHTTVAVFCLKEGKLYRLGSTPWFGL